MMKKQKTNNLVAKYAVLFCRATVYIDKKKNYKRSSKHKKDDYFQLVF